MYQYQKYASFLRLPCQPVSNMCPIWVFARPSGRVAGWKFSLILPVVYVCILVFTVFMIKSWHFISMIEKKVIIKVTMCRSIFFFACKSLYQDCDFCLRNKLYYYYYYSFWITQAVDTNVKHVDYTSAGKLAVLSRMLTELHKNGTDKVVLVSNYTKVKWSPGVCKMLSKWVMCKITCHTWKLLVMSSLLKVHSNYELMYLALGMS